MLLILQAENPNSKIKIGKIIYKIKLILSLVKYLIFLINKDLY